MSAGDRGDLDQLAADILRRAASIVRAGWSQGATARNEFGNPIVSTAHVQPNIQPKERLFAPTSFDVTGAIFRASAQPMPPRGKKKEDVRLLYWSVAPRREAVWQRALAAFCRTASTMHASDWNDKVCKTGEEAALMLEAAAEAIA